MNYLTNYYKNLSEQLQDQVNYLQKMILEVQKENKRNTEKVIVTDAETPEGEYLPVLQGHYASGKGAKRGRYVEFDAGDAIPGESKQTEIHHAIELANGDADKDNIYTTGKPIKVRRKEIATFKNLKEGYGKMPHDDASREYAADSNQEFADIASGEEAISKHNKIAALIARHHADVAPHISRNLGSHNYDSKLSEKHMYKTLTTDKYFTKTPFDSVDSALDRIGGQFLPPVIYPQKGNKHWGNQTAVELGSPSGEIHPHKEELALDRIRSSIEQELQANNNR